MKLNRLSVRQVASQTGLLPSTICRITQEKGCDIDAFLTIHEYLGYDPIADELLIKES